MQWYNVQVLHKPRRVTRLPLTGEDPKHTVAHMRRLQPRFSYFVVPPEDLCRIDFVLNTRRFVASSCVEEVTSYSKGILDYLNKNQKHDQVIDKVEACGHGVDGGASGSLICVIPCPLVGLQDSFASH